MASLPLLVGGAAALKGGSTPRPSKPIPMPDVDALKRDQRRKYAATSTGRASTILTDTGGLG